MPLVPTSDLLTRARDGGYGIGAFNVIGLEHAQGIIGGAEHEHAPVILQVSQNAVRYHGGSLGPIGAACTHLAAGAGVPVALHLDHATTWDMCEVALDLGFGSVMFDGSTLPIDANVATTADLARRVHDRGRAIEAELGVVGGKEGAETSADGMTDPASAAWYVEATGVDALAVAVGTTHYMVEKRATIDLDLISRLREAVDVPLVLHGSSGVPDADLREAVRRGIVKVNIATELNKAFTGSVRNGLARDRDLVDPRVYLGVAREAVSEAVGKRLRVIGSSGRA